MKVRVKDAVITLINQERDGEEIDQTLLMEVLEIFQNMECYVDGFETAFLDDTVDYYTKKVSNWTPGDYTVKAEECLKKEKDRVSQYLRYSTKEKLSRTMMDTRPVVELEQGWEIMQMGITKVIKTIYGVPGETPMDAACLMNLITTVYNMCTQKPPHDFSGKFYEWYAGDYLPSRVLPSIQEKNDDVSMLQELVKRWANHKVMTLVKNVLEIFVDLGNKDETQNMVYHVNDFETPFLNDTADYYPRNQEEYAMKAEECLKKEKDRVSHYLHSSTEEKLLSRVKNVLNPAQAIA
ncbi:hypothetical protein C5167_043588 [Papaver somniferum]|uniref:Cullin N-terminal domain-containing protein n=1 Tax=Papaver somniferum TaxID=3469 RepID=A0A4Y7L7U6_PAPSO|nr:hypothetical protein C5167_043588 [Papaver somniferum]